MRGATNFPRWAYCLHDISIHAPRAGRDVYINSQDFDIDISIHAPRAGRDGSQWQADRGRNRISIHAPRAGRDFLPWYQG